ncbi:unnamed protein product, partial [Nesidiocoris tenuis]
MVIDAGGTVRVNRFFSPQFSADKAMLKKGRGTSEILVNPESDVVIVKWVDNNILASNFIGVDTEDTAKRWDKTKKKYIEIKRPQVVK